jgi:hypothetical protein
MVASMGDIFSEPQTTHNEQLNRIEASIKSFQAEVLKRLDTLEIVSHQQPSIVPNTRPRIVERNGQSGQTSSTDVDEHIRAIKSNPKITGPVQLGLELVKVLFTEMEFATSTVTGRKANGQHRNALDPSKMLLIDRVVQEQYQINGEAECAAIQSPTRDAITSSAKYLRLKLAPANLNII